MKKVILSFLLAFAAISMYAQNGILRGTLTDRENGETLIGATIVLNNDPTKGTATDLDGKYSLENLEEGTYSVTFSYVSYQSQTFANVEIKEGEVVVLDAELTTESVQMEEVVVEAKAIRRTTNALLALQRKSSLVMDGISSQQFSVNGDNNAASAVRRVTGISVEGGKYVYVRGLGDRYSKTTLNGAEIPGVDPGRNSVQLDMFPSNLLDNIIVYKTFSPDLPGDFTGGYVDVVTKDFPDRFTFQWSSSFSYNTMATFNDNYLSYEGGKYDWLGMDDGTRDVPEEANGSIPNIGIAATNDAAAQDLDRITKSFNKVMGPEKSSNFLNQNHSFSIGNQYSLFGKPFGFILGLSYQNGYDFYENGITGRYTLSGSSAQGLNTLLLMDDAQGSNEVLLGGLLNLSYKLSPSHKLSLNILRNQSGTSFARYQIGISPANFSDDGTELFETRTLGFTERQINSGQLKGEHFLESLGELEIKWHVAYTDSRQDQPDLRFFANDLLLSSGGEDTTFAITPSVYPVPSRFYRTMEESYLDNKINFALPYNTWGHKSKAKFGFSYLTKERTFTERRLDYNKGNVSPYDGNIDNYLADENIGIVGENQFGKIFGPVIQDASEKRNAYDADQEVIAGYLMTDLQISSKFKFSGGARIETTTLNVVSHDNTVKTGELDNVDILPGLNFIFSPTDKQNYRLSYSRTIARPTFRELAPFASFDFIGDFTLVGNPDLERSLIDNFDLRWELFPNAGEIYTVSLFYKNFNNPIEKVIEPRAQNTELSFRNVDQATVYGAELEVRKNLGFITPVLSSFMAGFNVSYIQSEVDINEAELALIRATDPDAPSTRQMFAQSPYLLNAFLNYKNEKSGTGVNLGFNMFGERLMVVSAGATPNVYEQPRPTLDCAIFQNINSRTKITVRANNLLDPYYNLSSELNGVEFPYTKYKLGRTFSVGFSYLVE